MVFTVLFDVDEKIKDEIINRIVNNEPCESLKEYSEMVSMYKRAYLQLTTENFYDFFKHRKKIDKFVDFNLKSTVSHSKPYYKIQDGKYIVSSSRKCPICSKTIPEDNIEEHIKSDLEQQNKVIVILDSSIRKDNTRLEYESCTVKDIKKDIYDKIGVSVSKLEVYRNADVLGNSVILKNETVIVKQKRRSNK